ncbi:hypothetical protein AYK61_02570 [Rhodococcus sp. SBT000017]|uniref:hypothetical protein n=1 Tax=unclassified Rhodococcus (in: high G+C Gram-positive bacteria) TaxID=192944 RepID=UPI000EF8A395|nr:MULTISPECIES: hypothetical protein [unclassified Rhodococcus (in: high G+C Gram-positive bacteria)]RMB75641.1 hypothetical protein AYK61_02570 [Rhodococcus sp. SBT000017]
MTHDSEQSRVIAAMRLSGSRFHAKGMPAESLVEVAALEDILRSLVRLYWRDRHPNSKRIPNNYDDRIALRLVEKIGDGSAVPLLEYDLDPGLADLFAEDELKQDYSRALLTVEAFIEYALSGEGQIPADIRRIEANKVKKLGQTMDRGDTIQVAATNRVDWESVSRYTPSTRTTAIEGLDVETKRAVVVEGRVVDFHVMSGRLIVRDREHKRDVAVPYYGTEVSVSIDPAQQLFKCHAEGIGDFNADGRLTKLASVTTLAVVNVTEDARLAREALTALADLDEGWMDGEAGEPISDSVIQRGQMVIESMLALGNLTSTVFPTEEGGIRFYWSGNENQLSIEVEPDGAIYVHTADTDAGTFNDETIPAEVSELTDALDSWLSADGKK